VYEAKIDKAIAGQGPKQFSTLHIQPIPVFSKLILPPMNENIRTSGENTKQVLIYLSIR
jgi:hypothetical protein